jgi:hypothetical protein
MTQIQFQLADDVIGALRAAAARKGITPNILGRIILHEHFSKPEADAESKSYTFISKNWREIEAYVEVKCLGNVAVFTTRALEDVMSRNRLTAAQKAKYEKILGN